MRDLVANEFVVVDFLQFSDLLQLVVDCFLPLLDRWRQSVCRTHTHTHARAKYIGCCYCGAGHSLLAGHGQLIDRCTLLDTARSLPLTSILQATSDPKMTPVDHISRAYCRGGGVSGCSGPELVRWLTPICPSCWLTAAISSIDYELQRFGIAPTTLISAPEKSRTLTQWRSLSLRNLVFFIQASYVYISLAQGRTHTHTHRQREREREKERDHAQ